MELEHQILIFTMHELQDAVKSIDVHITVKCKIRRMLILALLEVYEAAELPGS